MRLLTIVPIAPGIRKEVLTYFSSKDILPGSLVTIPLRNKQIGGIVLESLDALAHKSEIKDMEFTVKKIIDFNNTVALPEYLMNAAERIAHTSATSVGSVISSLVPKTCLENPQIFFTKSDALPLKRNPKGFELLALQVSDETRIDVYKSIIRESFAKKKSIVLICPTKEHIDWMYTQLSKGIEDYVYKASFKSIKKLKELISLRTHNHPVLIIGTIQLVGLIDSHVGTIILENESSPHHKSRKRPYLDNRAVVREVARELTIRALYGDKLLSVETLAEVKEGNITEYSRIERRSTHKIQTLVVDMKSEGKQKFDILSKDLIDMISYAEKSGKKLLIYSARRGLSPQTVCQDCGTTVLCDNCENPIVLHSQGEKRYFLCHHCGTKKDTDIRCLHCTGWNLIPLGIGIERIAEEVAKVTTQKVLRLDSDSVRNAKEARSMIDEFLSTPSILITTDLGLSQIAQGSVDFVAVPSLDTILSMPDFRTSERVMHTVLDLKSKARELILVQTRNNKNQALEFALSGDLEAFSEVEIQARRDFGYPPFVHIIKLQIESKKETIREESREIIERFAEYNPIVFPVYIKRPKGRSALNIVIKVARNEWPKDSLYNKLMALPPHVKIDASPASLL